jgi:hypothetical protein
MSANLTAGSVTLEFPRLGASLVEMREAFVVEGDREVNFRT